MHQQQRAQRLSCPSLRQREGSHEEPPGPSGKCGLPLQQQFEWALGCQEMQYQQRNWSHLKRGLCM